MAKKESKKPTKISNAEKEALMRVKEYKLIAESNIVSILWKNPDQYFNYDSLGLESFTHNEWKVYFQIGYDIVVKEKKPELDEITVGLYLEKHDKLREKYDEYGGFQTINLAKEYVKESNIDGYVHELNKWNTVIQLAKNKFPIADRLSEYTDMSSEQIYDEYEAILNHIFINVEGDNIRRCFIDEDIDSLLEDLDKGLDVGLPYYNMPLLNNETNGLMLGEMYLLLAPSGVGKSSFLRSLIFPSIIQNDEKLVIMINEEDIRKVQKETLVWVCNNIYKTDLQKHTVNGGNFSDEVKAILRKSAEWIKEHREQILVMPMDKYSTDKAIKIIKKYAALGYNYFLLDTFKHDSNITAKDNSWLDLQLNSVKLYDTIKPNAKNVCLVCTMQLTKQSVKQRCLTMESISGAKNVVDVATGCYMIRWVLPDEHAGEKHELKVYKISGKNGKTKIPVQLDENKRYQLLFLTKNRFGTSNEYCIVMEVDLSRNIYREVGICVVQPDW